MLLNNILTINFMLIKYVRFEKFLSLKVIYEYELDQSFSPK